MAQNKILQAVFEKMDDMGWNLGDNEYDDFLGTYEHHKNIMESILDDENRPEDNITWLCQFMIDFLTGLENI